MQYKAYAYQYYTLSAHSSPLSLRMKQQKPAPANENLVYIFTSLIHPVAKLSQVHPLQTTYPKQYKETWHATTSLSTPPSSQHHLAGIAVVSCLLFIHTTLLVIHIAYGRFVSHHMRLVI